MGANTYRELLIGCGLNRDKKIGIEGYPNWQNLTTLDSNGQHNPDDIWDLEKLPLPYEDNTFDEIHAYDVLEHTGQQGDWKFFFNQFTDLWRISKPNGLIMIIVPSVKSVWAWGDPSHKRVLPSENFIFLSQKEYAEQVGKTPMSDFRFYYKADFEILSLHTDNDTTRIILKTIKGGC